MGTITLNISNTSKLSPDNWDSLCEDFLNLLQDLTPVDTGYCQESWEFSNNSQSATFHNSAEYASFLDEGWSKQAPTGMTGPALDELPSLVAQYL